MSAVGYRAGVRRPCLSPLTSVEPKDEEWEWTPGCETAWLTLKRKLITFPMLRIFGSKLKTVLYTDSSKAHVGGVIC